MIQSFGDQGTADIYSGISSRAARATLPKQLWGIAQRKLSYLNAATSVKDLSAPPGNCLEALKGALEGFWSIRINDQYRVTFRFRDGNAHDVQIVDYH
jgi:proteic killer suppression protein